jgi:hypothetical protein
LDRGTSVAFAKGIRSCLADAPNGATRIKCAAEHPGEANVIAKHIDYFTTFPAVSEGICANTQIFGQFVLSCRDK